MQSPIKVGTVLKDRYYIIYVLAQREFVITYLAEDQRRFNQLCAIKQFIDIEVGVGVSKKIQDSFEREATALYQIEHPQIPKLREKFSQHQSLFLVQDYIGGKKYQTLLNERKSVGQTFTQTEVLQLMRSLLPVLAYIHKFGIIHRDISPKNLILRDVDYKPVLIEFGMVKELATNLSNSRQPQVKTMAKLGYSPSEQIQSGKIYPHSDLYALAVTVIVLLTGQEPENLFDQTKMNWKWQQWVDINPRFAEILNRMLSSVPGDRYQRAKEVLSALENLNAVNLPFPNISYQPKVAVTNHPQPLASNSNSSKSVISSQQSSSILDNPLAITAIGSVVVIFAGFGSWMLVSSLRIQQPSQKPPKPVAKPQSFPSPVIPGIISTPTLTPTNTEQFVYKKRLRLGNSNPVQVNGTIKAKEVIQYSFTGDNGQNLNVAVEQGTGVLLTVLKSDQQPMNDDSQQVTSYQGLLFNSGKYIIQLTLSEGMVESDYSLSVSLENSVEPTPTEIPTPTQTPTTDSQENNPFLETTPTPENNPND